MHVLVFRDAECSLFQYGPKNPRTADSLNS